MTTESSLRSVIIRSLVLPFTAIFAALVILDLHHWIATGLALGLTYTAGAISQRLKGQN